MPAHCRLKQRERERERERERQRRGGEGKEGEGGREERREVIFPGIKEMLIKGNMSFSDSGQPTYGDYDYQFVGTISSKYICSICSKILHDPHLTSCCGQHFCASCLTNWLGTQQGRKTCPHCRQENFVHIASKAMIREVNELKIC